MNQTDKTLNTEFLTLLRRMRQELIVTQSQLEFMSARLTRTIQSLEMLEISDRQALQILCELVGDMRPTDRVTPLTYPTLCP